VKSKKALIRRMAALAAGVLALGLAGVGLTLVVAGIERAERAAEARREQVRLAESARADLEELAQRITSVPVDPITVGEVQAAYFAEMPQGRRFVWAMGSSGEFLFGVPSEAFARINQLWDAHQESLEVEGRFVDRQDFLRRLVRAGESDLSERLRHSEEPVEQVLSRAATARAGDDWLTFSTPLRTPDGAALGNLYLQVAGTAAVRSRFEHEGVLAVCGATSAAAFAFLWFLLPTWVFVDARERGVQRAALWSFLVLVSLFLGLVVYLIARPEQPSRLQCPACGRELNGGAFCPHCGQDLARSFCSACRYPLKPDWVFCPSCRTGIGRVGADEGGASGAGITPSEET
jgi:hypothetical protein